MDSSGKAEETQVASPVSGKSRRWSDDATTVHSLESPGKDLESQTTKPTGRRLSSYFGRSSPPSPVTDSLDDIDEELDDDDANTSKTQSPEKSIHRIDDHPNGYPRLAALMNSDENFLICRKYGFLHNRVLLYRQDELRVLEQELVELDGASNQSEKGIEIQSRVQDDPKRKALIEEIDRKLEQYNSIVKRTRDMSSLQKATKRNHESICNWVHHSAPLVQKEAATFGQHERDFIALVDAKEGSWFDGAVETMLSNFGGSVTRRLFISKADRESTQDKEVRLYSKHRINTFSRLFITFLAIVLMMAPVVALFITKESGGIKILIIFVFTMVFSSALSLFTRAKRHEVFASTAA